MEEKRIVEGVESSLKRFEEAQVLTEEAIKLFAENRAKYFDKLLNALFCEVFGDFMKKVERDGLNSKMFLPGDALSIPGEISKALIKDDFQNVGTTRYKLVMAKVQEKNLIIQIGFPPGMCDIAVEIYFE
jgi:hypothetical protein